MKHNNSANKTPEKVRGASHNDYLQLSPIFDERSEETTPVFIEQVNSELNHNFKCEYCDTTSVSQHALKISITHQTFHTLLIGKKTSVISATNTSMTLLNSKVT